MKLSDFYRTAILWTCYLENYQRPERYLNLFGLGLPERLMFDRLGQFFPFDEYYDRGGSADRRRGLVDLEHSPRSRVIPWMYRPLGANDRIAGKDIVAPSLEIFLELDNKIEAKKLFEKLNLPTPRWGYNPGRTLMVEKPIRDSAAGLGVRLTREPAREGCFLEEYMPGCRSIGIQYFIYNEPEFICADEMLLGNTSENAFTFHTQKNVVRDEIPDSLQNDCDTLGAVLAGKGYRGFVGFDVLLNGQSYYFLEVNPRGIAFLPAYFAATARGWMRFQTYTRAPSPGGETIILLDFGAQHKVVERLP